MPRKQGNIGSLLQGVSQQNFKTRLRGMHEEQINFIPHETAGIIKRSPTKLISKLTSNQDNNAKMHYVKASDGIEYIIVITDGDVKIFNTLGQEQTLSLNNPTYLDSINISTDVSLVTIGDYTIINNKTVIPLMDSTITSSDTTGKLIEIVSGEFNTDYALRFDIDAKQIIGSNITGITGAITIGTPTLVVNDASDFAIGMNIDIVGVTGTKEISNIVSNTITIDTNADATVSGATVDFNSDSFNNGEAVTGVTSGATGYMWTDYTGGTIDILNDGTSQIVGAFIVGESIFGNTSGSAITGVTVTTIITSLDITESTPSGSSASHGADIKIAVIADELVTKINADTILAEAGYSASSSFGDSNVISIINADIPTNADIALTPKDPQAGRLMQDVSTEVKAIEDLPNWYISNRKIKVSPNRLRTADDFYMQYIVQSSGLQFGGTWVETVADGITTEIDPLLAPHAVVKLADGTFYFGSLDGTVIGGTTIDTWSPRAVGSDDTNPIPTWIGRPIEHLNVFQQRLIVLTDEFISISKTSEFFNFFRTTATEVLDSDAIGVSPVGGNVTVLKKSIQQNRDLIIFSDTSQYLIEGKVALTPSTVAISEVSSYSSNQIGELVSTGDTVLFTDASGVIFSEVHELFVSDRNNSRSANNLTKLIPTYITNNIKKAKIDTNLGIVAFSAGNANKMYFYKYINNNRERVQSAWYTFEFNTFVIADYVFYPHGMYLLTRDSSGMYLESMSFDLNSIASGVDYDIYLDRRQEFSSVNTTVTTDFDITENTIVVQGSESPNAGYTVPYTAVGNVITLEEDMNGGKVIVGNTYDSTFNITAPRIFTQEGIPSSRGRFLINSLIIDFEDTVRFNTTSLSKGTTYNKEYEGVIAGESLIGNPDVSSGVFKVAVKEKNSEMQFSINSDTHFPVRITNIDYDGQYSPNARR